MKVDYALDYIKDQLIFGAKKEIIGKFNATNDEIVNNFEYHKDGALVFRHPFSLIDDEGILETFYMRMLTICVSQVPIHLLVEKGGSSEIIRNYNDDYDIRKPNPLVLGDDIDIDEPLAVASLYETLDSLGLSEYRGTAKNILSEYERNLVIPTLKNISALNFRFSTDKISWHSSYEDGDNYFSIYQNGSWGNAIPLISGNIGATNLTSLADFPNTHEAGKILRSTGARLEWIDLPTQTSGGGSGAGATMQDEVLEIATIDDSGIDLSSGSKFKLITLSKDTEFKVKVDSNLLQLIEKNKEYKILVALNGYSLTFKRGYIVLNGQNSEQHLSTSTYASFKVIFLDSGFTLINEFCCG